MDQLKVVLKHIQKYHFWLLAVVCMTSGLVGWMMASRSLSAAYLQEKGKIEKAFSGLKSIRETENFPNSKWKEELGKLTQEERGKVRTAWEMVYSEQQRLLKWPEFLGPDFLAKVASTPPEGELGEEFCARYALLIQREAPTILGILNQGTDSKPLWAGQAQLERGLDWKGRAPRSIDVWLAQEDLWVYAAVLNIFRRVNAEHFVPPIQHVDTLLIGVPAAKELQRGMGPGWIMSLASSSPAAAEPAAGGAGAGAGGEGAGPLPDEGRYVDAAAKPMPGGAASKDQFKRMPVYMELKIDQREIPKLLVECANSPLPLEVLNLRINPSSAPGAATTPSSSSSKSSGNSKSGSSPTADVESYDVPLKLAGIIYIYNRPDISKLGGDAAAAGAAAQPAVGE